MVTVSAGTDTYGRVKSVCGTPIVTKFAMLQALPLYPLQSFYFVGTGRSEIVGVPFIASSQSEAIHGISLSHVDTTSVVMAYARGIFGALAIIGSIAMVPIIIHFTGERLDQIAWIATYGLLTSLVVGAVGGLLTYAIPLTSRREREIRTFCTVLLGISADPARVPPDIALQLQQRVELCDDLEDDSRTATIRQLIAVRAKIGQAMDVDQMERKTDELLAVLTTADRNAAHESK